MSNIYGYRSKPTFVEAIEWHPENKEEIRRWVDYDKIQFDWIGDRQRIQVYNAKSSKWNISDHRTWFVVKDSDGNFSLMEELELDKLYDLP